MIPVKRADDGDSDVQKHTQVPLTDTVGAEKKSYTPSAPDRSADKGGAKM